MSSRNYLRDGAEIYRRSFAAIRAEADLAGFAGAAERVVVRMIHACGMIDLPRDVELSPDFAEAGASPWWSASVGALAACAVSSVGGCQS